MQQKKIVSREMEIEPKRVLKNQKSESFSFSFKARGISVFTPTHVYTVILENKGKKKIKNILKIIFHPSLSPLPLYLFICCLIQFKHPFGDDLVVCSCLLVDVDDDDDDDGNDLDGLNCCDGGFNGAIRTIE